MLIPPRTIGPLIGHRTPVVHESSSGQLWPRTHRRDSYSDRVSQLSEHSLRPTPEGKWVSYHDADRMERGHMSEVEPFVVRDPEMTFSDSVITSPESSGVPTPVQVGQNKK